MTFTDMALLVAFHFFNIFGVLVGISLLKLVYYMENSGTSPCKPGLIDVDIVLVLGVCVAGIILWIRQLLPSSLTGPDSEAAMELDTLSEENRDDVPVTSQDSTPENPSRENTPAPDSETGSRDSVDSL